MNAKEEYRPQTGDVFVASWGYDQTNVDAFVVVGVSPSGKSVDIKKCGFMHVERAGHSDEVIPNVDDVTGFDPEEYRLASGKVRPDGTIRKQVSTNMGILTGLRPRIKVTDGITATLHDGDRYCPTPLNEGH